MTLNLDKTGWKRVAFGDVVRNVNNTVKNPAAAGLDRVIAMEHLDPGELKIVRWGDIADGTTFTRRVTPGQTLFGKRRAYQRKAAYAEFDAVCSGDILTFEADPAHLLADFLPFIVQSDGFYDHALGTSAGSLSPRTNWRDLSNFEFDLPPLDEQKRIADLMWALERHRERVRSSRSSVAVSLNRAFESAVSGSKRMCELRKWVARIDAGRSPRAAGEPAEEGQFGVLKVSAVGLDRFHSTENKRLLHPADFRPQDAVRAGDLLVTRANAVVANVARPCIVDRDYPNLMLSDKTLRLVPAEGYPSRVVLAALHSQHYRAHVREVVNGTEAKNISQAKILQGPVPDLDREQVGRLAQMLEELDGAARAVASEIASLDSLRSSLLADIFGGAA